MRTAEAARAAIASVLVDAFDVEPERSGGIEGETGSSLRHPWFTHYLVRVDGVPGERRPAGDVRGGDLPVVDRDGGLGARPRSRQPRDPDSGRGRGRRREPLDVPRGLRRQPDRHRHLRARRLQPDRSGGPGPAARLMADGAAERIRAFATEAVSGSAAAGRCRAPGRGRLGDGRDGPGDRRAGSRAGDRRGLVPGRRSVLRRARGVLPRGGRAAPRRRRAWPCHRAGDRGPHRRGARPLGRGTARRLVRGADPGHDAVGATAVRRGQPAARSARSACVAGDPLTGPHRLLVVGGPGTIRA